MDWKKLKQIVAEAFQDSYENAGGQNFRYIHSCNVAAIAKEIAEKVGLGEEEQNLAVVAGLFHDIGKAERIGESGFLDGSRQAEQEQGLVEHEKLSAEYVRKALGDHLTAEQAEKVAAMIESHGEPQDDLAKVLHDADDLSEMGAMNIWKMSTYSTYTKRDLLATVDYWFMKDRARHEEKRSGLYLEVSKEMATECIATVDKHFEDIQSQML